MDYITVRNNKRALAIIYATAWRKAGIVERKMPWATQCICMLWKMGIRQHHIIYIQLQCSPLQLTGTQNKPQYRHVRNCIVLRKQPDRNHCGCGDRAGKSIFFYYTSQRTEQVIPCFRFVLSRESMLFRNPFKWGIDVQSILLIIPAKHCVVVIVSSDCELHFHFPYHNIFFYTQQTQFYMLLHSSPNLKEIP